MEIINREQFLALEGFILFCEVVAIKKDDGYVWEPKPDSPSLKIRTGTPVRGTVYEVGITEGNLEEFDLFARDHTFASQVVNKEFISHIGDDKQKYFLVYSKEEIKGIVNNLLECL